MWTFLVLCVSWLSCHCGQMPDRNNFREKSVVLVHDFGRFRLGCDSPCSCAKDHGRETVWHASVLLMADRQQKKEARRG